MAPDEDRPPEERRRLERIRARAIGVRAAATRADEHDRVVRAGAGCGRRLPGDEQFGDPLSTAAERPLDLIARGVSALAPAERPSAVNEVGLGALQVWQALSERTGRGRGDAPASVLFTDLVGFSSWALGAGDAAAVELLRRVGEVVEGAVVAERGVVVKRLGDGLMAVWPRPMPAVEAALTMLERLEEVEVEGYRPQLRAGLHHGHPRKLGGDLLGVDVNVAARVGEAAPGGTLLVSEPTAELLDPDRLDLGRPRKLKAPGAPPDLRTVRVRRR
jgi:adenylate cyclase